MRLQQPNTLEEIELAGDEGSSEVPKQPGRRTHGITQVPIEMRCWGY